MHISCARQELSCKLFLACIYHLHTHVGSWNSVSPEPEDLSMNVWTKAIRNIICMHVRLAGCFHFEWPIDRTHESLHYRLHERMSTSTHERLHDRLRERIYEWTIDRMHGSLHDRLKKHERINACTTAWFTAWKHKHMQVLLRKRTHEWTN